MVEASLDLHSAEDGIDNTIAERLRSKKGRVSDSIEVQWQKIWELLFPGTPVKEYRKELLFSLTFRRMTLTHCF